MRACIIKWTDRKRFTGEILFSGYGVDTGNGCSMDDHALKYILSEQSQNGEDDIYDELEESLEKRYEDTRS